MSTSVAKPTEKYNEYSPKWTKCRDAVKGDEVIKGKGTTYLPKLSGQEEDDYTKYKGQALFYNASGRTFKGFKGLVFRKDPDISAEQMDDFVGDCTLSDTSLVEFAEEAVAEELKTARFGVLVDYPSVSEGSNMSQAEAEQMGIRPFLVAYRAEDIIGDPQTIKMGGRTVLGKIRLKETYTEQDPEDEFSHEQKERIRVLDLTTEHNFDGIPHAYRQRVFKPTEGDSEEWVEDTDSRWFPKISGQPITEIPFYMVGGHDYREPHLLDLVNANLSHYVAYADHRRGVSWTTRPQPYGTGVGEDDMGDEMVLGGGTFWNFPSPESRIGMLEYSGDGLSASEKVLDKLEEMMANLGARMLMPENNTEETATEFVIKKQGENSALGNVSKLVSQCLSKAMQFAAGWMGIAAPEEVNLKLNMDFVPVSATPEDLMKMIGAVQSGRYTMDDYLWWLEQNEMVDPSMERQERQAKMETEPTPGLGSFNANGG